MELLAKVVYSFPSRMFGNVLDIPSKRKLSGIYLFKVNNKNTKRMCKICSKLIVKTPG